ncbi:protein BEAN1-like isoform X2 [Centrocercus urophasianus]|uniref:protein BEAN1-like isoform X2 n=1 Tax=Centrocercus urophasianus TaxID=9002 RepID=UPI001C64EC6E|nr:protein BEAN1-like isoform X2 [Centrocercus urophasianus]
MSIQLTCSKIHLNQSSPTSELPSYTENGSDASLLVSPLLVAGVVIGLVLFLSCVTIIVGSLRKDGRLRHPHQRRDTAYAPDSFSYGGSFGELRSTCLEEFPPAFDFGSYLDTLSQVNIMYPDSPPRDIQVLRVLPPQDSPGSQRKTQGPTLITYTSNRCSSHYSAVLHNVSKVTFTFSMMELIGITVLLPFPGIVTTSKLHNVICDDSEVILTRNKAKKCRQQHIPVSVTFSCLPVRHPEP